MAEWPQNNVELGPLFNRKLQMVVSWNTGRARGPMGFWRTSATCAMGTNLVLLSTAPRWYFLCNRSPITGVFFSKLFLNLVFPTFPHILSCMKYNYKLLHDTTASEKTFALPDPRSLLFRIFPKIDCFSHFAAAVSELQAAAIRLLHWECLGRRRRHRFANHPREQARVAGILKTFLKFLFNRLLLRYTWI